MNKELSKLTTVVIVTINGSLIYETLDEIYGKFKVIIIENNFDKKFETFIKKKYPLIDIILPKENLGMGGGNNVGIKKTLTPYVLVLNPDVKLTFDDIIKFESYAKKIKDFSILAPISNGFVQLIKTELDKIDKNFSIMLSKNDEINEIPWVPGWCMFCKMEDLKNVNYFDENFFLYFEELDICKKLKKKGKKFFLLNNIEIFHEFHGTSNNKDKVKSINHWKLRNWHLYWSSFYYHQKHYGYFRSLVIHLSKYLRFLIKKYIYLLIRNEQGYIVNKSKSDGILSSMLLKKSSYRVDL